MADTAPSPFPTAIFNADLVYLGDKLARFTGEVMASVSSNVAFVNEFDFARWMSYLASADAHIAYVNDQPQLDLPESHPMLHTLKPFPDQRNLENDEANHIYRLLRAGYIETVNSQSARNGAGLIKFDASRIAAVIAKTRQWLTDYVAKQTPQDLPETSPQSPMSPAGKLGV